MKSSTLTKFVLNPLLVIAGIALISMMTVITVNVFGRLFFHAPLLGAIEIGGLAGVVLIAISLFYTEKEQRNVYVEALVMHLPTRIRSLVDAAMRLLSLAAVALLFWAAFEDAMFSAQFNEPTLVLGIYTSPFKFVWALGLLILCLYLLKNIYTAIRKVFVG